ncbi:hypothetical protein F5Y14DRAFT_55507 [Nemania sp. NC0429]|nr:hypothetical protein F5Y14DRAFT_55507 [Nemania sp. NC0429]
MLSSHSPIHEPRRFSPAGARHRCRKSRKAARLQALPLTRKRNHTTRVGWDRDEREDGRRLAYDPTVALPGEGRRPTPRLERQEAFWAPKTWDISDTDVVVDDDALYRLGILYDDDDEDGDENEHVRGSGFTLDTIVHAEPVYSLRPAKRAKKTHDRRLPLAKDDLHLSVELLSSYLSHDASIARFLMPRSSNTTEINTRPAHSTTRESPAALLSIIYELDEGSTHSLAPAPATSDVPDLVSDSEAEQWEEYEVGSTSPSIDWAFVPDPSSGNADSFGDNTAGLDGHVEHIPDGDEETTNTADDAWIFLARDDS